MAIGAVSGAAPARPAAGDCEKAVPAPVRVLCEEPRLTALYHKLTATLARASAKAGMNERKALARGQRDWLASRDACAGASSVASCLETVYSTRIAALEQSAELVAVKGPFSFSCGVGQTAWVTFAETHVPSARLQSSDYDLILFLDHETGSTAPGDEKVFANSEFALVTAGGQLWLSGNEGDLWCRMDH